MTQLNAYVNFNGNCREAMTFYQDALGGELTLNLVADSPMAEHMPPEAGQNIMHSMLVNKGFVLMASDMMGAELVQGNSITLSLNCSSEEEGSALFTKLSAGGQVTHPFEKMFWGAFWGSITDQFGVNWMVNFDPAPIH